MSITQDEFNALMEAWIAANGGRYNAANNGASIDAAVSAVKNKEATWDAKQDALVPDESIAYDSATKEIAVALPNKAITRAEYDALSDEDKQKEVVYDIVDDFTSESVVLQNEQAVYSATDEVVVGRWIDGRPIYKKTLISNATLTNSTIVTVADVGSLNIDSILNGFLYATSGSYKLIGQNNQSRIELADTALRVVVSATAVTWTLHYCVVEYTKTTDEATIDIPTAAEMAAAYEEGVQSA